MMSIFTKRVKYNEGNPRGIEHPTLFLDRSLYEVSFPNGHHYRVLNDISDQSVDGS